MNNLKEIFNPLHHALTYAFKQTIDGDLKNYYLKITQGMSKWKCFSDYCFDDRQKPNDVIAFTIIPYIHDSTALSSFIQTLASADIKNTSYVSEEFLYFLKQYPFINFSFILENRKRLFGKNHAELRAFLKQTFELLQEQYGNWIIKQPDQKEQFSEILLKLKCTSRLIDSDKKIKQILDMLLVTYIGAFVSSRIIKNGNTEIFGWFSDRDALNEICGNLSIALFHNYLHGLLDSKDFMFVAAPAGSKDNAFYEELVRIPDYIAGALADYDMAHNSISKDKFGTLIRNYMAENNHNNFVFKIFLNGGTISISRIIIQKKETHN